VRYSFVPVWLFINEGTVLYSVTHTVMIMEILSSHATVLWHRVLLDIIKKI